MKDGVCLSDTETSTDSKGKRRIGGYVLGRTIGEGSFAKVKEGVHILTNERVRYKQLQCAQ
jgi:Neu-associated kinase